jgi:hypothetical protein
MAGIPPLQPLGDCFLTYRESSRLSGGRELFFEVYKAVSLTDVASVNDALAEI